MNGDGDREWDRSGTCDSPLAVSSRAVRAYGGLKGRVVPVELGSDAENGSNLSYSKGSRDTGKHSAFELWRHRERRAGLPEAVFAISNRDFPVKDWTGNDWRWPCVRTFVLLDIVTSVSEPEERSLSAAGPKG